MTGTVNMLFIIFVTLLGRSMCNDLLPCTEGVGEAETALAERILGRATPPGYRLIEHSPLIQTGRNPHRWVCRFERLDNVYSYNCAYLTNARTDFKKICPVGCEISQVGVSDAPNQRYVSVEYLVNCGCRKIRKRRSYGLSLSKFGDKFLRERSTCTGFSRNSI